VSLRPIEIKVAIFRSRNAKEIERSRRTIPALMFGLVQANRIFLEYYPGTPALYDSPVLYRMEQMTEQWQDIPTILRVGYGDCEDLACWRCAELRHGGIAAMPYITWREDSQNPGRMIYHALVKWPNGLIEDPSRALGMRHPVTRKPVFIKE